MRITMSDYRRSAPFNSGLFGVRKNNNEVMEMSDLKDLIEMINDLRKDLLKANEDMTRALFDIQREQLNIRRELVSIQREEMNLKIDAIKGMKEITKNDDLDFLKQIDAIDSEYLDKSIERAKRIQELHNEAIFK